MAKKIISEGTAVPPAGARKRAPARKKLETAAVSAASAPGNNNKLQPTQAEIAEAAYYRHLKRGGTHGDEFSDWVEAERELRERHSR